MATSIGQSQREDLYEIIELPIGSPPVGTDHSFTIPINTKAQILSCNFLLTTDATVADRNVGLLFFDQIGNVTLNLNSCLVLTASNAQWYSWSLGIAPLLHAAAAPSFDHPLPHDFYMLFNWTFRVHIGNMQAGDQISQLYIRCKRWIVT